MLQGMQVQVLQSLVVRCQEAGVMVTQRVLLCQVVVLLVDAGHVLCLHPGMGQVLRWWQHFLPQHDCLSQH